MCVAFWPSIGLLVLVSATSRAARFVDSSFSGTSDGSSVSPFKTINAGLNAAASGEQVFVAPGSYVGQVTSAKTGGRLAVWQGAGTGTSVMVNVNGVPGERALRVTHDDFEVNGATSGGTRGFVFDQGYGDRDAVQITASDVVLRSLEIRRTLRDCVDLTTSRDVYISDAFIHHCVNTDGTTIGDAHGVTGDSVFNVTVERSDIWMTSGDSIQFSPSRGAWDDVTIRTSTLRVGNLDESVNGLASGTAIGENAFDTKTASTGTRPKLYIEDVDVYGWETGYIANQAAFNLKERLDVQIDRVSVYNSEIAFRLRGPDLNVQLTNAVVYGVTTAFRMEDALPSPAISHVTLGTAVARQMQLAPSSTGTAGSPTYDNFLVVGAIEATITGALGAGHVSVSSGQIGAEFSSAGSGDYRLVAGSSACTSGTTVAGKTQHDRLCNARFIPCAGAYENTTTPAVDCSGTVSSSSTTTTSSLISSTTSSGTSALTSSTTSSSATGFTSSTDAPTTSDSHLLTCQLLFVAVMSSLLRLV